MKITCKEWLKKYLSAGSQECGGVKISAKKAGFSKAELTEARKALGVKTWHQFDHTEKPFVDNWFWYLPGGRI